MTTGDFFFLLVFFFLSKMITFIFFKKNQQICHLFIFPSKWLLAGKKKNFVTGILTDRDFTSSCTLVFMLLRRAELLLLHLGIRNTSMDFDNRGTSTSGNGTVPIRANKFPSSPLSGLSHH